MGKGSRRRPGDDNAYVEGYERIYGKPKRKGERDGRDRRRADKD